MPDQSDLPARKEDVRKAEAELHEAEVTRPAAIKAELRKSLEWTAATIVACFVALPFVTFLTTRFYYISCLGLLVVVGMAIYCV